MIVKDIYRKINDTTFVKIWSDNNLYIKQAGTKSLYSSVVEPDNLGRNYIETDKAIPGIDLERYSNPKSLDVDLTK